MAGEIDPGSRREVKAQPRGEEEPPLLVVDDVAKHYGGAQALAGVSLRIDAGEIHGLLGHNGAGKSTLVKILGGLVQPDRGSIWLRGKPYRPRNARQAQRAGIALVDQEVSLIPTLTVEENLMVGAPDAPFVPRRASLRARCEAALETVGLSHLSAWTRVSELGLAERQLIEVARLLGRDAQILVLDEPTATLSESESERVFSVIRHVVSEGRGVIFVSHRLDEIFEICNRVTVLRDGSLVATSPIEAVTRADLVSMIIGDRGDTRSPPATPPPDALVEPVLVMEDLVVDGLSQPFTLTVKPGQLVGLAGQVGSGASAVILALAGARPVLSGTVRVNDRAFRPLSPAQAAKAGVVYVPGERKTEGLFMRHSIGANLLATRLGAISRAGVVNRSKARRLLGRLVEVLGIEGRLVRRPVRELSGGNQQKVLVSRCLEGDEARLITIDDPTRGVDIHGRAQIHELLRHRAVRGGAVVFASSDIDEVLELADIVVTMFAGHVVDVQPNRDLKASEVLSQITHRTG